MIRKEKLSELSAKLMVKKDSEVGALHDNLLLYVADKELTLSDIANASEVPFATLNTFLYGSSGNPKIATVIKLAKALNVSIDELVGAGTLPELSSESLRLCRDMSPEKLMIVRWFIRYLYSKDNSRSKENRSVTTMIPNVDNYGNMSVTPWFEDFVIDCEDWKINRCYMGMLIQTAELLPWYAPNTILLVANDRKPMDSENVIVRIKEFLYICRVKTKNGSTNYYFLNDKEASIDKAVISEVMGYIIGCVPVQSQE